MKLTPKQIRERDLLAKAHNAYLRAMRDHVVCVPEENRWGSAICAICGASMGWWCPKNKETHLCEYKNDPDHCLFCGMPEERK